MPDGTQDLKKPKRSVVVQGFCNSVLDPNEPMLGPVENGGTIIANLAASVSPISMMSPALWE